MQRAMGAVFADLQEYQCEELDNVQAVISKMKSMVQKVNHAVPPRQEALVRRSDGAWHRRTERSECEARCLNTLELNSGHAVDEKVRASVLVQDYCIQYTCSMIVHAFDLINWRWPSVKAQTLVFDRLTKKINFYHFKFLKVNSWMM